MQESEDIRLCVTTQVGSLKEVHIDDRRYDDIVQSLSFSRISSRQEQVDNQFDSITNSYDWIFDNPRRNRSDDCPLWSYFAQWLKSGHGVYWINGKAGSGKSTLMHYIYTHERPLEYLGSWSSTRRLLTPAFFFWNSGVPLQKTIDGLLRSVIYQMLRECRELVGCFDVSHEITRP